METMLIEELIGYENSLSKAIMGLEEIMENLTHLYDSLSHSYQKIIEQKNKILIERKKGGCLVMVERYHIDVEGYCDIDPDGEWVKHEDYVELEAKHTTLMASFLELFETSKCMLNRCADECYRACSEECAKCEFTLDIEKAGKIVNMLNKKEE